MEGDLSNPTDKQKETTIIASTIYDRVADTIKIIFTRSNSSGLPFVWNHGMTHAQNFSILDQIKFNNLIKLTRLNIFLQKIEGFKKIFSLIPSNLYNLK